MIHKLLLANFLLLLLLSIVHSHFHSTKEFESTLTRCCEIGTERAPSYPTSLASTINVTSHQDFCTLRASENSKLSDVPAELRPQCSSIIQHCCVQELNKQTCRFSKSLVKERLDGTAFSLNKQTKSGPKSNTFNQVDEKYYRQCLNKPVGLPVDANSTASGFHRIVSYGGSQTIFSECCVACKLGLFSALNDYKCVIQRTIKPSKLFEESFYDCCFNLKRELNFTSGKMVDISSMEMLIYPELSQIYPPKPQTNSPKVELRDPLASSQPLIKQGIFNVIKSLEDVNGLPGIRTQIVPDYKIHTEMKPLPDYAAPKEQPDHMVSKELPDYTVPKEPPGCPKGMRLDERNSNMCVDDNCQRNQHRCKSNQKCIDTDPGFKCVPRRSKPRPIVKPPQQEREKPSGGTDSVHLNKTKPNQPESNRPESNRLESNRPESNRPESNRPVSTVTDSDLPKHPTQTNPPVFRNAFAPYQPPVNQPLLEPRYLPNPRQYPPLPPNRFPPINYPNLRARSNPVRNQVIRVSKRKLIDKCAIGNHNCETQTQTCRRTENDFVCVNNQDLAEYDRMNQYNFDESFPVTTTTVPPTSDRSFGAPEFLCPPGFEFNVDNNVCADINECETGAHNCSSDYRCDNKIGSFICTRVQSCGTGYTYNHDTNLCEDINECRLNLHQCKPPYGCVNLIGSFRCELSKCKEGFRLLNNQCVPVSCPPGFRFNPLSERCVDTDECLNGVDPTDLSFVLLNRNDPNQRPDLSKHERLSNGRVAVCPPEERCVNVYGGFICENPIKRLNELMKEDDQMTRRHAVDLMRTNSVSKTSDCIVDPSAAGNLEPNGTRICSYKCVRFNDEWTCQCPEDYTVRADGSKCVPIDRCKLANPCQPNEVCVNLRGSHKCVDIKCPPGYTKNPKNQLQCVIIDKAAIYSNQPKYISFSYLSLQSNLSLNDGPVRIASIRGARNLDVDYKLISAESQDGAVGQTNLARGEDFELKRAESDHIYLKRSLVGPQEIHLEFPYTSRQNDMKITMNKLLLTIYVSKYSF